MFNFFLKFKCLYMSGMSEKIFVSNDSKTQQMFALTFGMSAHRRHKNTGHYSDVCERYCPE